MKLIDKVRKKIKEGGICYAVRTAWHRSIDAIFIAFGQLIFRFCKTDKIIIIESHNDFDCNGGAFYDYLMRNGLNKEWKIIWLLRNPVPENLPYNVIAFNYWEKSLKKEYYLNKAKYILCDDKYIEKRRKTQTEIYCTHGGITYKNVVGKIIVPEYIDYILSSSPAYDPFMCKNYSIPYPNNRMLHIGFPSNDILFENIEDEVKKITVNDYKTRILWMPTFRRNSKNRNDSDIELPLGIPLFMHMEELESFNTLLASIDCVVVLKIHPMEIEESYKKLHDMSNIVIVDGKRTKELGIDGYKLMKSCDALLSDYSSSVYSYLLTDRPIGFVLSDLQHYKLGLTVENYEDYMPGPKIYDIEDIKQFVVNVSTGRDEYKNARQELISYLYTNPDGGACKRLCDFLRIKD